MANERHSLATYVSDMLALEELGGHPAAGVKSATAGVEGMFAGAYAKLRKTKVAKGLRDDYAASAMCIVSYAELLSTACGFHHTGACALAEKHMRDYTELCKALSEAIPEVVALEIKRLELDFDTGTIAQAREAIMNVWKHEPVEHAASTHGTVEPEGDRTLFAE